MSRFIQFAWTFAAVFFLLSVLIGAVGLPWWRRKEREQQQATDNQLRLLKSDTSGEHIYDA